MYFWSETRTGHGEKDTNMKHLMSQTLLIISKLKD
jgi:hypothetical protein